MRGSKREVSLIVPTYNGPTRVARLLSCISRIAPVELLEVLICDDGSSERFDLDGGRLAGGASLRFLRQDRDGARRGCARNLGIREAQGETLLFIDDDCLIGPKTLAAHVAVHKQVSDCAAVGYRVRRRQTTDGPRTTLDFRRRSLGPNGERLSDCSSPWRFGYTCNLSVSGRARKFEFASEFRGWGYEDLEYSYRLFQNGISFCGVPRGTVWHIDDTVEDPFRLKDLGKEADFTSAVLNAARIADLHKHNDEIIRFVLDELVGLRVRDGKCVSTDCPDPPAEILGWALNKLRGNT